MEPKTTPNPTFMPWGDKFDQLIMKAGETTYAHSGEDLAHETHKDVIESKLISIKMLSSIRMLLLCIVAMQAAILAVLLAR